MILVFALLVYIGNEVQEDRTSYWIDIKRCIYHAEQINNNSLLRNGNIVTAICLPEWVDTGKVRVLK